MKDARICACGKIFSPYDKARTVCIECYLSKRDRERVAAGPTKREPVNRSRIIGSDIRDGRLQGHCYDERLSYGFSMLNGMQEEDNSQEDKSQEDNSQDAEKEAKGFNHGKL